MDIFSSFNDHNTSITKADINKITNFNPINVMLYQKAFIHKSVLRFLVDSDIKEYNTSYERFEFLGDSVLNIIIAEYIFNKYPDKEEGYLTRIRTKLVNGKTLAYLAKKLELNKFLIISKNVETIGGRNNDRILEDVFEAFLCSIYKDLGFKYTKEFVLSSIEKFIDINMVEEDTNYKDILLRKCQQMYQESPEYELKSTTGPAHKKMFTSVVIIKGQYYSSGTGKTKKESEQMASKLTLDSFN